MIFVKLIVKLVNLVKSIILKILLFFKKIMCKCKNKCDCNITSITKGEKGDVGEQGLQGIQGPQGPQGPQGEPGESSCCNFVARIIQNEITNPEQPLFSAVVTPSTPGVTYEWQTASFNDSLAIVGSTTNNSIVVDFSNEVFRAGGTGDSIFMETFRVIVRSEDGCCVADAYFNALFKVPN